MTFEAENDIAHKAQLQPADLLKFSLNVDRADILSFNHSNTLFCWILNLALQCQQVILALGQLDRETKFTLTKI